MKADNKNQKVQFGLIAQGHIPTIERILAELGHGTYAWEKIGKEIGWDAFTACAHYVRHISNKK